MAGDWIKMRHCLWTHPKVVTLARYIGQESCNASVTLMYGNCNAVGALFRAWCVADLHADADGVVGMSKDCLDGLVGIPGFSDALERVGWLKILDANSLQFLNYQEHNGITAKSRAQTQKRVKRLRKVCNDSVTPERYQRREEKRREEKKIITPLPPSLDTPEFRAAWDDWCAFRVEKKKKLTPTSVKQQFTFLADLGPTKAVESIRASIRNSWTGLFPPDRKAGNGTSDDYQQRLKDKFREFDF